MQSNFSNQQYLRADLQLSEPNFDDEATLLSARRVVPLDDAGVETRSGKRLFIGVAMVFAVLVGAFGATLFYKQRGQKQTTAVVETSVPLGDEAASRGQLTAGVSGAVSDRDTNSVTENVQTPARDLQKVNPVRKITKTQHSSGPGSARTKEIAETTADDSFDENESRRTEWVEMRRLERMEKREARREARDRKRRHSDDLLRIREIFEGSPRP